MIDMAEYGLGPAAIALMASGGLMDVFGSYYQAKQQKSHLKFEADISAQNARIAEMAARSQIERGSRDQQAIKLKAAKIKAGQRVATASSGFALDDATAIDIATETDYFSEMDANMAAYNATQAAWGYKTQAQQMMSKAKMNRATAKSISAGSAAATSLLSNASSVAVNWYQLDKLGAFDNAEALRQQKRGGEISSGYSERVY